MQVTVDYVNPPKPGKRNGTIKSGTTVYSYNPAEITFVQGASYEIDAKQSDQNPNLYFVNKAKPVRGNGAAAAPGAGPTDRFWLPFVSNTVAHAIAATLIQEPMQIKAWAAAAKQAAIELDAGREPGEDDDMDI